VSTLQRAELQRWRQREGWAAVHVHGDHALDAEEGQSKRMVEVEQRNSKRQTGLPCSGLRSKGSVLIVAAAAEKVDTLPRGKCR
jgi:hypothetical protein